MKQMSNPIKPGIMKKIIFAALALFTIGIATASADKNRIIAKENLPQKSQQFINSHFSSIKVSYVKEEYDFFEKSFEVVFADGSKVEFARNGEWKEVDCRYTAVPTPIVPQAIVKYIKSNYPDVKEEAEYARTKSEAAYLKFRQNEAQSTLEHQEGSWKDWFRWL